VDENDVEERRSAVARRLADTADEIADTLDHVAAVRDQVATTSRNVDTEGKQRDAQRARDFADNEREEGRRLRTPGSTTPGDQDDAGPCAPGHGTPRTRPGSAASAPDDD
jgi:hypothetical protein